MCSFFYLYSGDSNFNIISPFNLPGNSLWMVLRTLQVHGDWLSDTSQCHLVTALGTWRDCSGCFLLALHPVRSLGLI